MDSLLFQPFRCERHPSHHAVDHWHDNDRDRRAGEDFANHGPMSYFDVSGEGEDNEIRFDFCGHIDHRADRIARAPLKRPIFTGAVAAKEILAPYGQVVVWMVDHVRNALDACGLPSSGTRSRRGVNICGRAASGGTNTSGLDVPRRT